MLAKPRLLERVRHQLIISYVILGYAPASVPEWIPCDGFAGVLASTHRRSEKGTDEDTHLLVRAVAFPESARPSYAVVVDILVNEKVRQQLRRETGVEVKSVSLVPGD